MKRKYRHLIQVISSVICNGYILGFQKGKIFQGRTKLLCVPVLNCYSCPGAFGSCPIGSLQALIGSRNNSFPFYVLGLLMLFGIVLGRLVCGFLCPFGLVQDILYKISVPKWTIAQNIDRKLRYLKYFVLILLVMAAPLLLTNAFGIGSPYFCKLICPAGTLEGGIPLVISSSALQKTIGRLFFWKGSILILVVILSCFMYRPFCKYICPLGAFYSIFCRFSFYQIKINQDKCVSCGICEHTCKMQVRLTENKDIGECIRCGECKAVCPKNAIYVEFLGYTKMESSKQKESRGKK